MANITINNSLEAKGRLSVSRTINEDKTGFIVNGVFATHMYFEDIRSLESNRFKVGGVEVYQESFGSDDYNILYHFTAKTFKLKDIMNNGVGYILYSDEMRMIEKEMYKDEHPILGDIGAEYKHMFIEDSESEEDEADE